MTNFFKKDSYKFKVSMGEESYLNLSLRDRHLDVSPVDLTLLESLPIAWAETQGSSSLPPIFYSLRYPLNVFDSPLELWVLPQFNLSPLPTVSSPNSTTPTNLYPHTTRYIQFLYEESLRQPINFYSLFPIYYLTPLYTIGLTSFLEFISGVKVGIRVDFFTRQHLSPIEFGKIIFWRGRLVHFERIFSRALSLTDAMMIFYTFMKTKDLPMLVRWLQRTFSKVNFWKYRSFLYFLRYAFRYVVSPYYHEFGVLGVRFRLKGKISVAGNARTRKIEHTIGSMASSTKQVGVLHHLSTINTFTGVLGLQVWVSFYSPLVN